MNKLAKRIILAFLPVVISVLLFINFFGWNSFSESAVNINIHDTYFVIRPLEFIIAASILFALLIVLAYFLYYKFRNKKSFNYFLIAINALLILSLSYLIYINELFKEPVDCISCTPKELMKSWLSGQEQYVFFNPVALVIIQFLFVATLITSAFRVGKKLN